MRLLLFLGLLSVLTGCQAGYHFSQTYPVPTDGWSYNDTAIFDIPMADTAGRYDLLMDIDHTTDYAHQNLYVQIATVFPDKEEVIQTLSIDLADKQGRWYGDCRGAACRLHVVLQENAYFDRLGTHQVRVHQHMRFEPVLGVKKLHLMVRKRDLQ